MLYLAPTTLLAFSQAILVLVFLAGAWSKLRALEAFEGVVYNYRLLPEPIVRPVALLLPFVELAVGLGLMYPPIRPYAAVAAAALLVIFSAAIGINLLRGRREIDCGCFSSALKQQLSGWLLVRNAALVGLTAWLWWGTPGASAHAPAWLAWLVGTAAAITVILIYVTANLLATYSYPRAQVNEGPIDPDNKAG